MNQDLFVWSKLRVASVLSSLPLLLLAGCVSTKQAPVAPAPVAQPPVEKLLTPPPQEEDTPADF
jgi:hypothetical protein